MSTTTLIRGTISGLEYGSIYTDGRSSHIGHWMQDLWNEREYGAVAVEYTVPTIGDRMEGRTLTVPVSFIQFHSSPVLYASISMKEPDSAGYWRFGPTAGVISNEVRFYHDTRSIEFNINDLVWLSGKKVYLYLYDKNGGTGTAYGINAVQFGSAGDATLEYSTAYSLSIQAGAGSTIQVARQSSDYVQTGSVSDGDYVYTNDNLVISASPNNNYRIVSLTVNGNDHVSGAQYIVSGDVSVVSIAQVLASNVGATDADIEAVSTITIVRYDISYVHTLEYSFGSLTGYITANGATSNTRQVIDGTSVPFIVPDTFYSQIPNAATGVCTITCKTYANASSLTQVGNTTSCTFIARAAQDKCSPIVLGSVVDTNTSSSLLTGDTSKLVRYISDALCTISATAKNGASIVQKSINGTVITGDTLTISGNDLAQATFQFSAIDSRGYSTFTNVAVALIPYVKLTCNPEIYRTTPTGGDVSLDLSGMLYTGEWRSEVDNVLNIRYRYKEADAPWFSDNWRTIDSGLTIHGSGYKTLAPIMLLDTNGSQTGFDYRKSYVFQIEATDGDGTTVCSTVTTDVGIREGIPVFDWGKTDFKFNVPITISSSIYSPSITIGGTSITEEQLQQLLALLS